MVSHVDFDTLSALAEAALGAGEVPELGIEALAHLAGCEACKTAMAEMSALLAGRGAWEPEALDAYVVVGFLAQDLPDYAEAEEPLLAAADIALAPEAADIEVRERLQSADGAVTITVCEDRARQACRLQFGHAAGFDTARARFYMPPGVVTGWPEAGYLEFPLFLLRIRGWWSEIKLLYAREAEI